MKIQIISLTFDKLQNKLATNITQYIIIINFPLRETFECHSEGINERKSVLFFSFNDFVFISLPLGDLPVKILTNSVFI